MKILILAALLVLTQEAQMNLIAVAKFKDFVAKYNKVYNGADEVQKRFENFVDSLKKIERLNSEAKGLTLYGINEYSDWTWEEFKQKRLVGPPANADRSDNYTAPIRLDALPDNWDWRVSGIVTPVKNQGNCGSCWSFATVAVVEAMAAKAGRGKNNYAEQQMVDCVDGGCNGGNLQHGFGYAKDQGLPFESDYPYQQSNGQCHDAPIRIKLSGMADVNRNENDMAWSIHDGGPLAVASKSESPSCTTAAELFQTPTATMTFVLQKLCKTLLFQNSWHAVAVVGFGTENGHRYWIAKNSWGTGWGEQGFFRNTRGSNWCSWTNDPTAGWV